MRELRYMTLLPVEKLRELRIAICGVGAVGRQVARQLATMDVRNMLLVDPQNVATENLGVQGYTPTDLDRPKVEATGEFVRWLNPKTNTEEEIGKATPLLLSKYKPDVVFSCVDSMRARKMLKQSLFMKETKLLIDTRMNASVVRVLSATKNNVDWYNESLFDDKEGFQDPCTARATAYTSDIAAGLATNELVHWLNFDRDDIARDYILAIGMRLSYKNA